ncbi:MAG TPA: gephyrin-like molybdotransferase Glp [Thermoanaerobaculia bacterium]|nr:gephyrin-like molybdotransferase Glp [Thermoanaerobaculia bacterium]
MNSFQTPRAGGMLPVEEAQQRVLALAPRMATEIVSLEEAHGRVLREDVAAPFDLPPADNSAMDGYAVRAEDVANAPVSLGVIGDVPAGSVPRERVERGTAMRIMTGAFVPDGADAVVQVELTDAGAEIVEVREAVTRGANIRRRGEDLRAQTIVLREGAVIRAAEVGVLASMQHVRVVVSRWPEVAVLSTGDELAEPHETLAPGRIVNSNGYSLAALVREAGAIARPLGIVRDDRDATIAALEQALASDFVLTSGGVSVGAFDFVKDALDALGAKTDFWRVAMRPGKPLVVSTLRDRLCFGLPGNPVSCMVAFHLFVAPALRQAMGMTKNVFAPEANVRITAPLKSAPDRRVYYRARVIAEDGQLVAHPMPSQGSGVSTSMLEANALVVVDPDSKAQSGATVRALLIGQVQTA